jgi:hypothetical protein
MSRTIFIIFVVALLSISFDIRAEISSTTTVATTSVSKVSLATTTADTPVATTTIATTTEETIVPDIGEVVVQEESIQDAGDMEEEEPVETLSQPIVQDTPSRPPLSTRKFEKKIAVDRKAAHTCEAETFRIDVSGKESARARVIFLRYANVPYEIEIGSLPEGIDMTFEKNRDYKYAQGSGEKDIFITFVVHNQAGSQKGDFSIPLIYTQKGSKDSSVICQINIVNQ